MNGSQRPRGGAPLALLVLASVVLLACGRDAASDSPALAELARVAGVKPGTPVLVFVYTDG